MITQRLTELVRDVLSAGPIGVVIVATPVVTLALAIAGVAAKGQAGRVATFGALGALGLGLLAAWAEVYGARARFVELTLHPERAAVPTKAAWTATIELARSLSTQAFAAGAALVLVPLVAVAAGVTWARAERGSWEKARAWTAPLALAAPVVLTAALLWTDAKDKLLVGEIRTPHERYDALMGSFETLDGMAPWVIVAGAVVGLVVIAVVLAAGTSSRPLRITGATLGVLGIALFAATRARAADGAAPLPYLEGEPWEQDVVLPLTNAPCAASTAQTHTLGALERRRRACAERLEPPPPRE